MVILSPLTIRPAGDGSWWALNKRETGWSSYGYRCDTLGEALDKFNTRATDFGRDKYGLFIIAEKKA